MASRRLALSLQQGLRAQRAINAVKPNITRRALATPVSHGSTTESTTLSNGFTVGRHWVFYSGYP
jgi:processing peptidase subunit beta